MEGSENSTHTRPSTQPAIRLLRHIRSSRRSPKTNVCLTGLFSRGTAAQKQYTTWCFITLCIDYQWPISYQAMRALIGLKGMCSFVRHAMARYSSRKVRSLANVKCTAAIARIENCTDNINLAMSVSLAPRALGITANVVGRTHVRCYASSRCAAGQTCSNGLPGIQNENVCCELACGTCGGAGCATRPGGAVR